ncbi:MAG: PCP reductase family protein, partial [Candidatus Brocadiales bacterium]
MNTEFSLSWTAEAKERLAKIPSFLRAMVIRGVEGYAKKNGHNEVTVEAMKAARQDMEKGGSGMPPFMKMGGGGGGNDTAASGTETGLVGKTEELSPPSHEQSDLNEKLYYHKEGEIPWTETSRKRAENAPPFVRPGIYKLMQKRAREESQSVITSEFLTKIRNESMRLAAGRMKKFGFDDLKMEVFEVAKDKIKNEKKRKVIDEIKGFLNQRTEKNEHIISLFEKYLKT